MSARRALFLIALAAALPTLRSQNPVAQGGSPAASPQRAGIDPRAIALIDEARVLQSKQRSYEALKKLDEAESVIPGGSALICNIRGSIFTAPPLKDYARARECFEAAEKLMPGAFEPRFNLTELLYVTQKFGEAEAGFAELLKRFPKLREDVRHLVQFKIVICQIKEGRLDDAQRSSLAFTFMDDTPAYYFTKASFSFAKNDALDAREWVAKAAKIFKPHDNAVYLDTLMEAGWISNITTGGTQP